MTKNIKMAIEKLDKEAEKINTDMAKVISSHIIRTYLKTDDNADIVLDKKKTLNDCMKKITDSARKLAENNTAVVGDAAVYEWVREYYEFAGDCTENKIIDLLDFV